MTILTYCLRSALRRCAALALLLACASCAHQKSWMAEPEPITAADVASEVLDVVNWWLISPL